LINFQYFIYFCLTKRHWNIIRQSQYENVNGKNSSVFLITNEANNEEKTLSLYKKNEVDYVLYADYFGIIENEQLIMINYNDLVRIKPRFWQLFDEKQYKTKEFSDDEYSYFVGNMLKFKVN